MGGGKGGRTLGSRSGRSSGAERFLGFFSGNLELCSLSPASTAIDPRQFVFLEAGERERTYSWQPPSPSSSGTKSSRGDS